MAGLPMTTRVGQAIRSIPVGLEPRALLAFQLGVIAALVTLSTIGQALLSIEQLDRRPFRGMLYFLYVDGEMRLPALYSSLALLTCAGALAAVAVAVGRTGDPALMRDRRAWAWLGGIFLLLTIDEALAIHERSIHPLRDAFGIESGLLFYAWIIPGAIFVTVVGVAFIPFLRRLPSDTRTAMIISGCVFLAGAIGAEAVAGAVEGASGSALTPRTAGYVALATVEEGLEMLGIALFLTAIVRHADRHLADRRGPDGTAPFGAVEGPSW